jgi:hypothetical protein
MEAMSALPPAPPPVKAERRLPIVSAFSAARFYIVATVLVAMLTVGAVLAIVMINPAQPNMALINIIVGITGPLMAALLTGMGHGILKVLDGHQSQLMAAIAQKERAQGVIQGLKENPNVNIE